MTIETMVEFRINGPMCRAPKRGHEPGEKCLMRVSQILCLFPEHRQVRTTESGWTLDVYEGDWDKVERAFRSAYLGGKVHAV